MLVLLGITPQVVEVAEADTGVVVVEHQHKITAKVGLLAAAAVLRLLEELLVDLLHLELATEMAAAPSVGT